MKKAFTTVNTKLQQLKEEASDISDSESDKEEDSHFQFDAALQFTQVEDEFEPRIANLFKQAQASKVKLNLKEVTLLDSQSTMDLMCN